MSEREEVEFEIPLGKLRGLKETSVLGDVFYSFLGIPYAKPPVGELRFKSPQPAEKWDGVRDATKNGPVAPYMDGNGHMGSDSSEDCLFVNVYTKELPKSPEKKYPVMVWVHGGGFTGGSGNRGSLGPDFLFRRDVILVTFNYRLGALGFLSLQTLECPGNYGLKDQRLLLQWVQQNLTYFGGDVDNVTLFGESAGGTSVSYNILSPTTKGLFKQAIAQSGSILGRTGYSLVPRDVAFLLGKRLGLETTNDSDLLNLLKNASAKDIVESSGGLINEIQGTAPGEGMLYFSFTPTAEPESPDAFFTDKPSVLIEEGRYQDIPLITGDCSREMLGFGISKPEQVPNWTKDEEFQALIPRDLLLKPGSETSLEVARRIRQFYFKDGLNFDCFLNILCDTFYDYGVYRAAKSHASNSNFKSPVYCYIFSYDGGRGTAKKNFGVQDIPGIPHSDDVNYIFANSLPTPEVGTPDYEFIVKMVDLWVNFAIQGKPTKELNWLPANKDSVKYLDLDKEFVFRDGYFKDRMDFWDEIHDFVKNSQK